MSSDSKVTDPSSTAVGTEPTGQRPGAVEAFRAKASESPMMMAVLGATAGLIFFVVALSILTDTFLQTRNLRAVAISASVFMVLGVGQALVMNTRGIDVSIGSIVGVTTSVLGGTILGSEMGVTAGIAASLGAGCLLGLFNGAVIVFLKVPPIIATLATLTAFRGLAFIYMGGTVYHQFPEEVAWFGRGSVLGVPVPIIIGLVTAAWAAYFLKWTKMGRGMTALGGNPEAARVAGVATHRYLLIVYTMMGFLAALAGLIQTGRTNAVSATGGTAWELHTIALVVIGGTSLWGGRATMAGVVVGALILGVLENGLLLLGFDTFWQMVSIGLVVIIAVGIRSYRELAER